MFRCGKTWILVLVLLFSALPLHNASAAEDEFVLTYAMFDFLKQAKESIEARLEYRFIRENTFLHPFTGVMFNADGARYAYAGMLIDFPVFDNLFISPSFAPGVYVGGNSKNLYFGLEFRSQLELSYRFEESGRFAASFNHISNASLGMPNPGVESLAISYIFPVSLLTGQ